MNKGNKIEASGKGLIPFLVFIGIYLGSGLFFQLKGVEMAFYQLPAPVAVFCGIISAFLLFKGNINEKFETFVKGCGNSDIIIMCTIYLLAGAFAAVSKAMGGVDSTANLGLTYIPIQYIAAGLFVIAGFISTATGTSVGAIVAVAPIAVDLAGKSGVSLPIILAAVMGGAMFGDDLSIISDTTIASTRTQGCEMRDKFKVNIFVAFPAAFVTIVLLLIFGKPEVAPAAAEYTYNLVKVMPYLFVLVLALAGLNVFVVLTGGIFLSGAIGAYFGDFTVINFAREVYNGFANMNEIFLLSLLTGGLAAMVTKAGGVEWILEKIQRRIKGPRSAQMGIGALVFLTDIAVANNTVAIIINGPIAKKLSENYRVDPRKVAGLLGIFSCIAQGLIPYGAQMLILLGFAGGAVTPMQIMPLLWYQQILAVLGIVSIYLPFSEIVIKRNPWVGKYKVEGA